jgi:hypothetical protein
MKPFDDELREALKRREPPDGFARKVVACIDAEAPHQEKASPWRWKTALFAAALLSIVIGLSGYREHLRRMEGERARHEVLLALRVTGAKLRNVQERINQVEKRTIDIPIDRN